VHVFVQPHFSGVIERIGARALIAVDIPIGLPTRVQKGGRRAEQLVAPLLGELRNSVFPTSSRDVVYAPNYTAAIHHARVSAQPFLPSPVAYALHARIKQVDALLRERIELPTRVFEIHPELAFWTMNEEKALTHKKKTAEGQTMRRDLLLAAGVPNESVDRAVPAGARKDDLFDALAALVVAEHIARDRGRSFPNPPERDDYGLPAAIWTFENGFNR
jgi:predicted RNase H-like nuclease